MSELITKRLNKVGARLDAPQGLHICMETFGDISESNYYWTNMSIDLEGVVLVKDAP